MKTAMKRTSALMIVCLMLVAFAIPSFAGSNAKDSNGSNTTSAFRATTSYENDYVILTVDDDGSVYLFNTTSGDPVNTADNNKKILYGYSSNRDTGTSYTTFNIGTNDTLYAYSRASTSYSTAGGATSFTTAPSFSGNSNYSARTFTSTSSGNTYTVLVEQWLTLVEDSYGNESVVEWHYKVTNQGTSAVDVGCRIMLDLNIAGNDDATIHTQTADYSTETELSGTNVPRYWYAYDTTSGMKASGFFNRGTMTAPDSVQFANWGQQNSSGDYGVQGGLWATAWDYSVSTSTSIGDSAVSATWEQSSLAAGASMDYYTYYGYEFETEQEQIAGIDLNLSGDSSVAVNSDNTAYYPGSEANPAGLSAMLQNTGTSALTNAYAQIQLPAGLSLASSSNPALFSAGSIAVGGVSSSYSWDIVIDSLSSEDRTFVIPVVYGSDQTTEGTKYWNLFVPGVDLVHTLTINYVYEDGTTAAPTYTGEYTQGNPYSVASPAITGFGTSIEDATVQGTMPANDYEYTVIYYPNGYSLEIIYRYANGTTAHASHFEIVAYGQPYSVTSPDITGYSPDIAVVGGTMPDDDVTITVTYTANEYTLTINYVYANGEVAAAPYTAQVAFGTAYSVTSPDITGYSPDIAVVGGTMPDDDVTITVTYTANDYTLTINYVYANGEVAAAPYTAQVAFGTAYSVTSPVIAGYTANVLVVEGTMPDDDVTITVTYTANEYTLTINYVYANGEVAAAPYTAQVAFGTAYSVTSPDITGYSPDIAVVGGTMPDDDVTITVTYTLDILPPTIEAVSVQLRTRATEDGLADMRFTFRITFNSSYVNYRGVVYGPEMNYYKITSFCTVINANNHSVTVNGTLIYSMDESSFTYTAVVKNIRPQYFEYQISAVGYLSYELNGEGTTVSTNEILEASVASLLG